MLDGTVDGSAAVAEEAVAGGDAERVAMVEGVIAAVRPVIQADGGGIELVAVLGDIIRVRLTGGCLYCALAGQTLGGIQRQMMERLGEPVRVPSASD